MMLFDYLVGNSDRHHSNWAVIVSMLDRQNGKVGIKPCPLYDNGSSLCCYVTDQQVDRFLEDRNKLISLVDTKSRSIIRISGDDKKNPRHSEVVEYLLYNFAYAKESARSILDKLHDDNLKDLLEIYPEDILSVKRKKLLLLFLNEKLRMLMKMVSEAKYG